MIAQIGPWLSPRDLLDYLGAIRVRLLATYECPTGRRVVRAIDPLGVIDGLTRWALAYWERDIWAALRAHAGRTATDLAPPWARIGRSRRGNATLRYPRSAGGDALYWRRPDAETWRRAW